MDDSLKKIEEIIDKFKEYTIIESLIDSQTCYEEFFYIYRKVIFDFDCDGFIKICEKNNYYDYFVQLLNKLISKINEVDFDNVKSMDYSFHHQETNLNERHVYFLFILLKLVNSLAPKSLKFRNILIEQDGLKSLLYILNDHEIVKKLINCNRIGITNLIFTINWLSKTADSVKSVWEELNAVHILSNFFKKFDNCKNYVLMILSNIANDKDLEKIDEFNTAIDVFSKWLIECTYYSNSNVDQQFQNEDETVQNIKVRAILDTTENGLISITGIFLVLYKISINDKRKLEIFQKPNLKDAIYAVILDGNDAEKQHALELLTQLCFDKTVIEEVKENLNLQDYVLNLSKSKDITFKKLYKTCEQYLWLFKNYLNKQTNSDALSNDQHIMISYNSSSRELCLKIKSYLESLNYKVWIDVDEIHGSSLDSMAKAVENSQCVLMCVTEKYRQSLNCQSEAQYAFRLNKPIIPCIFQKGYGSVGGWLGFIIGDKIFVDFTKYEIDDCLKRVSDQITRLKKNLKKTESDIKEESFQITSATNTQLRTENDVSNWEDSRVEKWFLENSFEDFFNVLKPINGKNLHQLHQLLVYTPEFFYKSLTKYDQIDIKKMVIFITSLKDLFENK